MGWGLLWALSCASAAARGQDHCATPPETPPSLQADYGVELFNGPVIGSSRAVGMAGAYAAAAYGIDGTSFNPAAYAERAEHELDWWEWEASVDLYLGGFFTDNDVGNDGCAGSDFADAVQAYLGSRMLFGRFGIGGSFTLETYALVNDAAPDGAKQAEVSFGTWRLGTGFAFRHGALVGGLGLRGVSFSLSSNLGELGPQTLAALTGLGLEAGVLFRPAGARYRLGAALRTRVIGLGDDTTSARRQAIHTQRGLWIPASVELPFELQLGVAYQLGERRANPAWPGDAGQLRTLRRAVEAGTYTAPPTYGGAPYPALPKDPRAAFRQAAEIELEAARRRLRAQPRRYTLLSGDLLIYGPAGDNVHGVEAFLAQRAQRSGQRVSVGLRLGVESEVLPMRLKLRGGFYVEPSRFTAVRYRPHVTAGVDVRLFRLWRWDVHVRTTLDLALRFNQGRYINWGGGLGIWR